MDDLKRICVRAITGAREGATFLEAAGPFPNELTRFLAAEIAESEKNIHLHSASAEAARDFPDESLDFVLIADANDFKTSRDLVRAWFPKIARNGVIAGCDAKKSGVFNGVQETIPLSELEVFDDGATWMHSRTRPVRGEWTFRRDPAVASEVFVFVPCVNRLDLLRQAIMSVPELWPCLVVVDQSPHGFAPADIDALPGIAGVFRSRRESMSFTQMMNWAQAEAFDRRATFLVFMHNDAECQAGVPGEVIAFAKAHPAAGVVFTRYDAFALFRTEALRDTGPWDESFRWYYSDVDYYRRIELAGWGKGEFGGDRVIHHTSQTLHADHQIDAEVARDGGWHAAHYHHKWGGQPGRERFTIPYHFQPAQGSSSTCSPQ